ncbi:hypothetical protein XAP412_520004 [Xanthomonas phaseoli pv. phaseoli]|uniref:Secreted protein n=1 Tax=Xanthomonas campestris pv. phaseoli TaxID=317013 RepID=A0AB38E243_XANCH|nr:hypothetical protein XAP6984_570004 [Xanthomonas phaseoli pv. phaseoli]SON87159.1 hypothetical protein XAP412_520004 [Xanthomonas phaseoli pv. phaseoli]SON91091.1 hypothetical protein XAP7430_530004 [Xanthomonas phaseoli pv. phaseoli]SOO31255.1 hypothetical protein XAP6164_520004 [Xanthomonas phaseoli pv. phaseoli]
MSIRSSPKSRSIWPLTTMYICVPTAPRSNSDWPADTSRERPKRAKNPSSSAVISACSPSGTVLATFPVGSSAPAVLWQVIGFPLGQPATLAYRQILQDPFVQYQITLFLMKKETN